MVGTHLLKSWASTQPTITLSSGEAELHGVVKAGANGMGMLSLLYDLGVRLRLVAWTDSTGPGLPKSETRNFCFPFAFAFLTCNLFFRIRFRFLVTCNS